MQKKTGIEGESMRCEEEDITRLVYQSALNRMACASCDSKES